MATDHIVGIDLGTTNSLVAFMQGDSPVVIPGDDGSHLVPSVVALDRNGQAIVGNAARNSLIETPERAIYSVKRLMGRGVEDIRQELKLFPFRLAEDLQAGEVLRISSGTGFSLRPKFPRSFCASSSATPSGSSRLRSQKRSLQFLRISTTRSVRPPKTLAASQVSKSYAWSMSPLPHR